MQIPVGAQGGVVVKALRYKPAGRGFDSPKRMDLVGNYLRIIDLDT
jgi:hypothetical protein